MKRGMEQGFTLIELLLAMAIVAILVAIAVPSYDGYVRKNRRTDGKTYLFSAAQRLERYRASNNTYTATLGDLNVPSGSTDGFYTISILSQANAEALPGISSCPIASCYALKAVPVGAQSGDGALILSSDDYRYFDANNDGDFADSGEDAWK